MSAVTVNLDYVLIDGVSAMIAAVLDLSRNAAIAHRVRAFIFISHIRSSPFRKLPEGVRSARRSVGCRASFPLIPALILYQSENADNKF